MNDGSTLPRALLLWGVPFAIVAVALGYETDWGRGVAHPTPVPAASPPQPVAVSLLPEYRIDGGVEARKETVDRVLFNPTRRPAPPATAAAGAQPSMQRGLYTLTGTTVVGGMATAFLREVKSGKSHSVRQGETLAGMLVAEVKPDRVRFKQGDDVEDLQLKIATGPKTTVQVAAPVAAAPAQAGGTSAAAAATRPADGRPTLAAPPQRSIRQPAAAPNTGATPRPGGTVSVSELLAERRRAARAAAEAAAAGGQSIQQAPARRGQPQ